MSATAARLVVGEDPPNWYRLDVIANFDREIRVQMVADGIQPDPAGEFANILDNISRMFLDIQAVVEGRDLNLGIIELAFHIDGVAPVHRHVFTVAEIGEK